MCILLDWRGALMELERIPYTWTRHLAAGLKAGSNMLVLWLVYQALVVGCAPWLEENGLYWRREGELFVLLATGAAVLAWTSVSIEWRVRGRRRFWRVFYSTAAALSAWLVALLLMLIVQAILRGSGGVIWGDTLTDPSLVSLHYRGAFWVAAGIGGGLGAWLARSMRFFQDRLGFDDGTGPALKPRWFSLVTELYHHLMAGVTGSLLGVSIWYACYAFSWLAADLYLGSALGLVAWGVVYGSLAWVLPEDLYGAWARLLTGKRFGKRIFIGKLDGVHTERFLGHYPRGLDLFVDSTQGVEELHVSLVSDGRGRFTVRGLSYAPTRLRRFLESIDLSYDIGRPAPLETQLMMEDRILVGSDGDTEFEFLMLPLDGA